MGVMALEWDGPLSVLLQRDNPRGGGRLDHLHQYQRGRYAFLRGPYDAMLVIESDILPPGDTLKRLWALDCDLAYGVYTFRSPRNPVNVSQIYPQPAKNRGSTLSGVPGLWAAACAKGVIKCSGQGFGCILIRRHVLEEIEFRLSDDHLNKGAHCDTFFHDDAYAAGFQMKADTRVLCGHKHEDGKIVFPERIEPHEG